MELGRLLLLLGATFVACAAPARPAATTSPPAPSATPDAQDADHDGIPDALDACPREPGVRSGKAAESGCPRLVTVEGSEDYILQQVRFTRGSSALLPESQPIVDETTALSQARARAVADRMLAAGLARERISVCGYGASLPIENDRTAEGRERNRRVEFHLVEDAPSSASRPPQCEPVRGVAP